MTTENIPVEQGRIRLERALPRSALQIFCTTIWAFMLRDMKSRYFTTRLGLFWAVADPAAIVVMLVAVHSFLRPGSTGASGHSVEFFFWAVWAYFMFLQPANAATGSIQASRGVMSYRQVIPLDVVVSRALTEWATLFLVAAILAALWWLAGMPIEVSDPLGLVIYPLCIFALSLSYGMLVEVASAVFPDLRRVFAVVMRPMIFISGLFFTMEMIPYDLESYLTWNPILHLVDLTRGAGMVGYDSPGSVSYALFCAAFLALVALAIYHKYSDFLRQH